MLRDPRGSQVCLVAQLAETIVFLPGLGEFRLCLHVGRVLLCQCVLADHDLRAQARFVRTEQPDLPMPVLQSSAVGQLADMFSEQALLFLAGIALKGQVRGHASRLVCLCRLQLGSLALCFPLGALQSALLDLDKGVQGHRVISSSWSRLWRSEVYSWGGWHSQLRMASRLPMARSVAGSWPCVYSPILSSSSTSS